MNKLLAGLCLTVISALSHAEGEAIAFECEFNNNGAKLEITWVQDRAYMFDEEVRVKYNGEEGYATFYNELRQAGVVIFNKAGMVEKIKEGVHKHMALLYLETIGQRYEGYCYSVEIDSI